MSIFKRKSVFWYLAYLLGIMFAIWAYRISLRNGAVGLYQFYATELNEFFVVALVLPVFSAIVLKKIMDYMNYSRILNMGSRCSWQRRLTKELIKVSMKYSFIILIPMSVVVFAFSENMGVLLEISYLFFTYVIYVCVLTSLALIILQIKMQWNMDVAAILSVLVIALIPYLFTKIVLRSQTLTFSEIINSTYLFRKGTYMWFGHELACAGALLIFVVIYKIVECQIKKKDFLWRQDGNEN